MHILKAYWLDILLIIVSVAWFSISLGDGAEWFQRSGSILVLCGVIIEFRHLSFSDERLTRVLIHDKIGRVVKRGFTETDLMHPISLIALFMIIAGTVTWAYGDLIYAQFMTEYL